MLLVPSTPIIVFIEGPCPTEEDIALFEKVGADQFVNSSLHTSGVISHKLAVAVNPEWIPAGYKTKEEVGESILPAPAQNPSAPSQQAPAAPGGIKADGDKPPVPPVALAAPAIPTFGVKAE